VKSYNTIKSKTSIQTTTTTTTTTTTPKKILVIVESPAKCKKIEGFLGGEKYKVIASFGHVREIGSLKNVDLSPEKQFDTTYQIISNDPRKKKHIDTVMRQEIADALEVILATDDDREGEAIAWHICELFTLPVESTKRIVFHEITESAIQFAITHPTIINMNIVNAQQSRQIIDLFIGYTVSPFLWKCINRQTEHGLSAGRCQTPALKLIYENQKHIDASPAKKVFETTGYFTNKCIPFSLNTVYESNEEVMAFMESSSRFTHEYTCSLPKNVYKSQPEPLTTSRIQQIASNEMHISPKETMKLCQTLYEGGYITYMRTDSKLYSTEFIDSVKNYILREFNNERYIHPLIDQLAIDSVLPPPPPPPPSPLSSPSLLSSKLNRRVDNKDTNTKHKTPQQQQQQQQQQQPHEAIRPTNILLRSIECETETGTGTAKQLTLKERKMYALIWKNALESCMSPAEYYSITAHISAPFQSVYSYTTETVDFEGWQSVDKYKEGGKHKSSEYYHYLQKITQGLCIPYKKITSRVNMVGKKMRYSEAKLVQLLEEHGIGRPSTFSSIVDKIQERGYVVKQDCKGQQVECVDIEMDNQGFISQTKQLREIGAEKSKLVIHPLGVMVMDILDQHFSRLFDYEYTKQMEIGLDRIANGEKVWTELCRSCVDETEEMCRSVKNELKQEYAIDETHTYMIGKFGPVVKSIDETSGKVVFQSVNDSVDIQKIKSGEYTLDEIVVPSSAEKHVLGRMNDHDVVIKKGRYGLYATYYTQCAEESEEQKSVSLACFGNRPIENIRFEDVVKIIEDNEEKDKDKNGDNKKGSNNWIPNSIRYISDNVSIRNGKYGDYIFYKTKKMTRPSFYKLDGFSGDYKNVNIEVLKKWIVDTHHVRL